MSSLDNNSSYEISPYRWVVLVFFILIAIMTQIIWISFAPITDESAIYFFGNTTNTSLNLILLLSMVFMIMYLPVNYFASKGIERFGLKWGTGIGVIFTGIFGFLRAVSSNYWAVLVFQIFCATGQPFILNSFTKLSVNWFAEKEKALATSLGTMAVLLGPVLGMFIPVMFTNLNIKLLLYLYGVTALFFMILYLIFVKDKPDKPPNAYSNKPIELGIKGTKDLIRADFILLFVLMFIGIGVFNALTTGIDLLFADVQKLPSELTLTDAIGIIGGVMIVGGIFGAIILSTLSDKIRKRKIFLILATSTSTIFTLLFFLVKNFIIILIVAFFFGFMLISALPIGLTFATEMTYPVPEETSNGWLMWGGQLSGILLIIAVMFIPSSSVNLNFILYMVLLGIATIMTFFLKDLDSYELKGE